MDVMNIAVSATVQCGIGMLFWFAVQRNIQKVDRLQGDLDSLKTERVDKLAEDMKAHEERNAMARKKIYEEIVALRTGYVSQTACDKVHNTVGQQMDRMQGFVIDLARVNESVRSTASFVDEVNQRVIAAGQDIARLQGQQKI